MDRRRSPPRRSTANAPRPAKYVPPGRARAQRERLLASLPKDDTQRLLSREYQQLEWDRLRKSIHGQVNRVNTDNLKDVVRALFRVNLVRGRGVLVKSVMKAQDFGSGAGGQYTPVYAALVAVVNARLPAVGALLLARVILRFQRAYADNDKEKCLSTTRFIAQLVNQQVSHELLALQVLALLLERPTDDSVEIAVGFMRDVGAFLSEASPKATHATFERFRALLHENQFDKRVQYMIEVLFQVRKEQFRQYPPRQPALDLVPDDEQVTHCLALDDEDLSEEVELNDFLYDPEWQANEEAYVQVRREILGDDGDGQAESPHAAAAPVDAQLSAEPSAEEQPPSREQDVQDLKKTMSIQDETQTNVINLRRQIYLTIMSSLDFEEACHKLLKISMKPGQQKHLCSMVIECCSQERSYEKYYGLMGERLCKVNRVWARSFADEFRELYATIHRYETNRIRNMAKFFAHLFFTDALPWSQLGLIKLTEDDTTSSSRIFVKFMFQEMAAAMGLPTLRRRLLEDRAATLSQFSGMFPLDSTDPTHVRFAINYFTSIGMGLLTDELRERLANMPKQIEEDASSRRSSTSRSYSRSSYSSRSRSRSVSSRSTSSRGRLSRKRSYSPHSRSRSHSRSTVSSRGTASSVSRGRSVSSSGSDRPRRRRRFESQSPSRSRSPVSPRRRSNERARSPLEDRHLRRRSPVQSRSRDSGKRRLTPSPPRRYNRARSRSMSRDRRRDDDRRY